MKQTLRHTTHYASIMLALIFLFIGIKASAQDAVVPTAEPEPARMMEREERQTERAEMRGERKAALAQQMQDRITNLASNMENRLKSAVTRMENIIGRLNTRIGKLNEAGVDTSLASAKLADAQNALNAAKDTLDELGSVRAAISSDTPRESFKSIREQFMATRDLLKQTHGQLQETVALLKDAVSVANLGTGVSEAVSNADATATEESNETAE